jgi:hypothetical protein
LAEILALLFAFERYATANNSACVFEQIELASHRCFPSSITIPPSTGHNNSGIVGTLGGAFMKGTDDSRKSSNVLALYPATAIPVTRRVSNGTTDSFYVLLRMIFLPKGPRHSALRRRDNSSTGPRRPVLWSR